ncbi:MAG TPA: hypothetical protein V6C85_24700 [Allocoleopsis sp.]
MADIKLNDLQPAGVDFFEDSEGYLSELSEDELTVWGGIRGGVLIRLSLLNSNVSFFKTVANSVAKSISNSVNISK